MPFNSGVCSTQPSRLINARSFSLELKKVPDLFSCSLPPASRCGRDPCPSAAARRVFPVLVPVHALVLLSVVPFFLLPALFFALVQGVFPPGAGARWAGLPCTGAAYKDICVCSRRWRAGRRAVVSREKSPIQMRIAKWRIRVPACVSATQLPWCMLPWYHRRPVSPCVAFHCPCIYNRVPS